MELGERRNFGELARSYVRWMAEPPSGMSDE